MSSPSTIRAGLMTAALCCAVAVPITAPAQKIPATAPTQPAPAPVTAPATVTAPQAAAPPTASAPSTAAKRAQVTFTTGQLTVTADNSSLNQILREVGRLTGMKITGGVTDERVYGTYGPSDTSTILYALLKGTGSNMMIVFDSRQAPQELVLTPRGGGPTPPNPNAAKEDREEEDLPPRFQQRPPNAADRQAQPLPPQPMPPPVQMPAETVPAPQAPPADTTTQQSPNGAATPQQIYDQLMKMQQQQQKTPPAPPQF